MNLLAIRAAGIAEMIGAICWAIGDVLFRRMSSLQKFASVHASIHNHFSLARHLNNRQTYRERRSAALAEWQILAS